MTPTDPKFVQRELRATPGIRALPSEERTANRMKALRAAPAGGYSWKEARDHFRDLARGDSDAAGRGSRVLARDPQPRSFDLSLEQGVPRPRPPREAALFGHGRELSWEPIILRPRPPERPCGPGSSASPWSGGPFGTDAGKSNARYVARAAWRAYHAKQVPATARQWGLLEASIRRTFEELETWGLTATRVSRPPSTL